MHGRHNNYCKGQHLVTTVYYCNIMAVLPVFQTLTCTHPPLYLNKFNLPLLSPFIGNSWYVLHLIYSLKIPSLACLDCIKQISIFWPADPHYQAYLNEYDAHSLSLFWVDSKYVFHLIYPLRHPSLTLLILSGGFRFFGLLVHISGHISTNMMHPLYHHSDVTL